MERTNVVELLKKAEAEMRRKSAEIAEPMFSSDDESSFKKLVMKAEKIENEYKAKQGYEAQPRKIEVKDRKQEYEAQSRKIDTSVKAQPRKYYKKSSMITEKQKELDRLNAELRKLRMITSGVDFDICTDTFQQCENFTQLRNKQQLLQRSYDKCVSVALQCIREKLESVIAVDETKSTSDAVGDKYRAYGLLLSACKLKKEGHIPHILRSRDDSVKKIMDKNISKISTSIENVDILLQPSIENALDLACKMVVLLPPAIVYCPSEFDEKWLETHRGTWEDSKGDKDMVSYRPVLIHGGTNTVAVQGLVGHSKIESETITPTKRERAPLLRSHSSAAVLNGLESELYSKVTAGNQITVEAQPRTPVNTGKPLVPIKKSVIRSYL